MRNRNQRARLNGATAVGTMAAALLLGFSALSCEGPAGESTGIISGVVTNSITSQGVANVEITSDPPWPASVVGPEAGTAQAAEPTGAAAAATPPTVKTSSTGAFSVSVPVGSYKLTLKRKFFDNAEASVNVQAAQLTTQNVEMSPTQPVGIEIKTAEGEPGATVELKATVESLNGSSITSYFWKKSKGVDVSLANEGSDTVRVTLPDISAFKAALVKGLKAPDRFEVHGVNPHALEGAETVALSLTVSTDQGDHKAIGTVAAHLPFAATAGIQNVPVGVPVLLHGADQDAYNWSLSGPGENTLTEGNSQDPYFTPKEVGQYTVAESTSGKSLTIHAGNWVGAISAKGADGRPNADNCTMCHNGNTAPDMFTPWRQSGHAEIFMNNINTSDHYSKNRFQCHTVGYNPDVANGGFDDASDYDALIESKLVGSGAGYAYDTVLGSYPDAGKRTNIQCENCHGPNSTTLHGNGSTATPDPERVSLSANVCGACHGEPARHGRFQQWEESSHGNFELAISRGTSAHCGRCHTAQGFLTWIEQGDLTKQVQGANGNASADEMKALGAGPDTAQPQTCVVCHDPHALGSKTGEPNDVKLRIEGDTAELPAGFQAKEVGRGALCMTCHNSRNGAHNDSNPPTNYSAPHAACQSDVLMGQNAYFVGVGVPSRHAYIEDTCVNCHMVQSNPPKEFSYNFGGTNHKFDADIAICTNCHGNKDTLGNINGKALQEAAEEKLSELASKMASYLLANLPSTFHVKDYMPHEYNGKEYDVKSALITLSKNNVASLEATEPHGQQGFFVNLKTAVDASYTPTGESAHTMSVTKLEVQLGDFYTDSAGKTTAMKNTDNLVKAGWNYFLIHGGSGEGVHNPTFTFEVLEASIRALN